MEVCRVVAAPNEFRRLMQEYASEVAMTAYDTKTSDAERFLDWLTDHPQLNQLHLDPALLSPYSVEFIDTARRLAHFRFQRLLQDTPVESDWSAKQVIHINPILIWASVDRLTAAQEPNSSACVFFPLQDTDSEPGTLASDVRVVSAVLVDEIRRLIRKLERRGPTRLRILLGGLDEHEQMEFRQTLRELADLGLVAVSW